MIGTLQGASEVRPRTAPGGTVPQGPGEGQPNYRARAPKYRETATELGSSGAPTPPHTHRCSRSRKPGGTTPSDQAGSGRATVDGDRADPAEHIDGACHDHAAARARQQPAPAGDGPAAHTRRENTTL